MGKRKGENVFPPQYFTKQKCCALHSHSGISARISWASSTYRGMSPLGTEDMNLPEGAGRHFSGVRHFWQSRKSSGCCLATTTILKSDSVVLAGERFICICISCWEYHCKRQRSWEESTLCWKVWKNRRDMPEAQVSKAALLLDKGWEEALKWKEEGEGERRRK